MKELQDMYMNFALSSFEKIEMTKLEKVLGKGYSHDRFTKMLLCSNIDNEKSLWCHTKSLLRDYENEKSGCILVDDSILDKPHTKESELNCWHYDHTGR